MPANWDHYQQTNNGRVEWPQGDITNIPPGNFVPRWVEAWVVQGGGMGAGSFSPGPTQSTSHSPHWSGWAQPYDRWKADVAVGTKRWGASGLPLSRLGLSGLVGERRGLRCLLLA